MTTVENLEKQLADALARERQLRDAAEMLWIVLANVSGGDWTKQSSDWQEAAARWRDNYFQSISTPAPRVFTMEEVRPLVEALRVVCDAATLDEGDGLADLDGQKIYNALAHARKLGMEDKQ